MVGFLVRAAAELVKGHFNQKKKCTREGCNRNRKGTGELCEKHQDQMNNIVFAVIFAVVIWVLGTASGWWA